MTTSSHATPSIQVGDSPHPPLAFPETQQKVDARANNLAPRRPVCLPWSKEAQHGPSTLEQALSHKEMWLHAWRRAVRWEFWPSWLYYIPIVLWLLWLSLRYRNPSAFTAANPALEAGAWWGNKNICHWLSFSKMPPTWWRVLCF